MSVSRSCCRRGMIPAAAHAVPRVYQHKPLLVTRLASRVESVSPFIGLPAMPNVGRYQHLRLSLFISGTGRSYLTSVSLN